MYTMPAGISEQDVLDWYGQHMPKGEDFEGLQWLEALPPEFGLSWDWYWCSGPAESLDIAFGENVPEDEAFVLIALQHVSDGACG